MARKKATTGTKRTRRGGVVKPRGKYEHLRVRNPRQFKKKPSLKTVPWAFVDKREQAFAKKKLGLRTIPKGTQVIAGAIKPTIKTDRVPGTRVKWLGTGIQSVLVPIRGGKTPRRPRGAPKPKRKTAQKVVRRARRKNPNGVDKIGADELRLYIDNDAALYRQQTTPIHKNLVTKMARGQYAQAKAERLFLYLVDEGAKRYNVEHGDGTRSMKLFDKATRKAVAKDLARDFKVEADLGNYDRLLPKKYQKKKSNAPKRKRAKRKTATRTRRNPGRLAILANPGNGHLPHEIKMCAKRMSKPDGAKLVAAYAKSSAADKRRILKAIGLYKKRHAVYPDSLEKRSVRGPRMVIDVGVGRAEAIEYSANKGYGGSSKRGRAWRHRFENKQHLVSDENGKNLRVVDRKSARKKTKTTDYIYN